MVLCCSHWVGRGIGNLNNLASVTTKSSSLFWYWKSILSELLNSLTDQVLDLYCQDNSLNVSKLVDDISNSLCSPNLIEGENLSILKNRIKYPRVPSRPESSKTESYRIRGGELYESRGSPLLLCIFLLVIIAAIFMLRKRK